MQSERVTYLTNAEQKAALEAFAKARGESVGSVVREATTRYMAERSDDCDEQAQTEELLELLVQELEQAVPRWNANFDSMEASIDRARRAIADSLERVEATK
ncbi:hypothetical protein [Novosphingopyxis sp.]|uniref:hypothetical protein n=1 Tax=Novosphingopyxis sp. TaxID=2709690 RepID=UPI003B59DB65